ncbi:putative membrane protein [Pseudarthrobacter defluvii]|uniref:DUF2254 family protein n=1 Tax=Pseudarthrobacter defluvii TaxID=410837 RepID=UPI002780B43C|nr:DUF2254 family protein [Pseudarthrobacter defluvii]MDQ0769403.1 putative membrane protein [Pseudarthrobacter defluvii]
MSGWDTSKGRNSAVSDPLRSSGRMHEAGRVRRGVDEFLRVPLLITAAFCVGGVLVSVLDIVGGNQTPLRSVAAAIVPAKGASDFVSAVATSLLTVTSITFSVLLLAVQQTASSLTSVVFDQFLRRRANQAYFGFFVGATAFTFLVLGLARDDPAPVYGAAITLFLTVAALVALLLLIHGTIDQMRPQSVVRSIHELALRARENELVLLGRTRKRRISAEGAPERKVRVLDSGYVVTIDVDRLAQIARAAGPHTEVLVEGRLGEYLVFDEVVVRLVGVSPDDSSHDDRVLAAFGIDDIRDVDAEAGYAIDQLENIAWATGTSASQSPNTATAAIRSLSDLLGRWMISGERDRSNRSLEQEELPVVYLDGAVPLGMAALSTLIIGTVDSSQVQTCAELIRSFARLVPRLHETDKKDFEEVLDGALPAVIQHAHVPVLRNALAELEHVMYQCGYNIDRVGEVRHLLDESARRLLPKPSDEPESAHPQ